ncbi:hypothetical protein NC653_027243 [Populus alba x Populus x berolinensis]|uniref:Uncharacterized protein n=1 Tax=Populus alba x Populus x berolinensis TaxID=444605 RepID=A0AAD6M521_9ROSI|nr:hypothetical protein NC653_027243 [Populus alba x Populus x berolinensis]
MILEKKVKHDVDKEFIIKCEGAHICYSTKRYLQANFLISFVSPSRFQFFLLIDMGLLIGSFGCVNSYSKKQCRALFWWLKAAVKKAVKKNGGKKRFKFQYDPSSYALNFDDGRCNLDAFKHGNTNTNTNILQESHLILWVCVLWVEEP